MSTYTRDRKDNVKRPDHYQCLNCGEKFNDAKLIKKEKDGIYIAYAVCPACDSTDLKISWWKKKKA